MKSRLPTKLTFSLTVAFILSACAMKETQSPEVAAPSSAAAAPLPAAPPAPALPIVPPRASIEATIVPGSLRDFEVNIGDRVFFVFDKSNLDNSARFALQKQAAWLQKYPAVIMTVEGYCDERGTREYNIALGARRAGTAKDYLVSLGVAAERLKTISFGKEQPICVESNEDCWSRNRRAVSVITNTASSLNVVMKH